MVCSGDGGVDSGSYGHSAGFADGYHGCCVLRAEDQVGGAGTDRWRDRKSGVCDANWAGGLFERFDISLAERFIGWGWSGGDAGCFFDGWCETGDFFAPGVYRRLGVATILKRSFRSWRAPMPSVRQWAV